MRVFALAAAAALLSACQLGPAEAPQTVSGEYQAVAGCILERMREGGLEKMGTTYLADAKNRRATLIYAEPPYVAASYPILPGDKPPYVFRISVGQTDSEQVLVGLELADPKDEATAERARGFIRACVGNPLPF